MNGPVEASFVFGVNTDTPGVVTVVATIVTRFDANDTPKILDLLERGLLPPMPAGWNTVAAETLITSIEQAAAKEPPPPEGN